MKKNILPQHIPDGQGYTEESLRELNSELRSFAPKGLFAMFGTFIGCLVLASIFKWCINGFIGNLLALITAISMPILVVLISKLSQRGYIKAAEKIGIDQNRLKEAIDNRNKWVAAWGMLPDINSIQSLPQMSPEELKKSKKKRTKRILILIGGVVIVGLLALFAYDRYLAFMSNHVVVELSSRNGSISESEYEEIVDILNRRADKLNARKEDNIEVNLKCKFKDGKIECTTDSNMLNKNTYEDFYMSGAISIVDYDNNVIVASDEIESVDYVAGKSFKDNRLMLKLSQSAFDKLSSADTEVFLQTDYNNVNSKTTGLSNIQYNSSSSFLVNNADGTTVYFSSVYETMYDSIENPLPFEVDIDLIYAYDE